MTTFDRIAYLKRISDLTLVLTKSCREVGSNIGAGGSVEEYFALTRKSDDAHRELLEALYDLPRELNGVRLNEDAA